MKTTGTKTYIYMTDENQGEQRLHYNEGNYSDLEEVTSPVYLSVLMILLHTFMVWSLPILVPVS